MSSEALDLGTVLVPVQLEAFSLNPSVCNTGDDGDDTARIIPYTQPNYTFLRLDNFVIQADVQNHADLHNTAPAEKNNRMTDLGARPPAPRRNRHGVYLHWILPRAYRVGVASDESASGARDMKERLKKGIRVKKPQENSSASHTPGYLQPPTRWIVIRQLDLNSVKPENAKSKFKEYQAWVIESDYLWKLDDIPLHYDLQADVSPFVIDTPQQDENYLTQQAEVFIGRKSPLEGWREARREKYTNISLLRSGNHLFADFQLHNSNVFSILDNFEYTSDANSTEYLDQASASYYLLGWHTSTETDPLFDDNFTHADKLKALFMQLRDSSIPDVTGPWLQQMDPLRLCCHGALYNVNWDHSSKPKTVPADAFAGLLKKQDVPAISVGTTPMDALLSYCTARKGKEDNTLVEKLEEDILAIDSLLHARDDGVEDQREAKDTVYNWNFTRNPGGIQYFLKSEDTSAPTSPTAPPDTTTLKLLEEVNQIQMLLDACRRAGKQYRWDMFSWWWKYVSDVSNKGESDRDHDFRKEAKDISDHVTALQERIEILQRLVDMITQPAKEHGPEAHTEPPRKTLDVKTGALPVFYRGRDPTVLVGGIDSGWPTDYLENVYVRVPEQVVTSKSVPDPLATLIERIKKIVGSDTLKAAIGSLCSEFCALTPSQVASPREGQAYPQFHDQTVDKRWRDCWGDRQPWFPLYTEWEIEYTHIPFNYWSLDEQTARLSNNKMVRYGINVPSGRPLCEELGKADTHDVRILSGRTLIQPQPSFSLAAKVQQLFQDTPQDILDKYLDKSDRDELLVNINKLSYLSYPLSGLTDGLLTMSQGAHIKPEINAVDNEGQHSTSIVKAAIFDNAGFTGSNIALISGNSAMTPYAAMTRFTSDKYCPFKPVTHGQFRFRKFNIIDKFGQAIVAIDPKPRADGPPPLYPCISDFYEPQLVKDTNIANTVIQDNEGQCEFIQLPPQINQNARLNAEFVKQANSGGSAYWAPVNEWENPIWGWIVPNYADSGFQLFLPDGAFYREIRFGGPEGTQLEPKWEPFAPDKNPGDTTQLDALVKKLQDKEYLAGFWNMITLALDSMAPAPDSYSQFLTSAVGKPFALANMGWSLELDGPPLQNQSTNSKKQNPTKALLDYHFQVKLGDKEREYDGLVGYFDAVKQPTHDNELDLSYVNTYFTPKTETVPLRAITTVNYPVFQPYWVPPFPEKPPYKNPIAPDVYADKRNQQLLVFGAIIDPFTPIHGYSSFLPTKSLQLPPWTWQGPMKTMIAFFHAGPLILTKDVPAYDSKRRLNTDNMKKTPPDDVALPQLSIGDWNWLQPYVDPNAGDRMDSNPLELSPAVYNSFGIAKKGNILTPGFEKGPYIAIEGFLQMRDPIVTEKPT